jgi:hypothetical protein
MTAMNIVHMRVKPGQEAEFIALHKELNAALMVGMRNFWLTKVGERSYCVVGEWTDMEALVNGRPAMIASLDKIRPVLEDLGGGRGLTEPYSGEVAFHSAS